ncbi:helix-turn-helix domain-containing protein [Tetraselmis virus 1]|uniref:Helix-turn-helix domain-containing protein n=1 Tax=Tetraselmis virus 1 TaxID=2060617 RepID=A0A2P0VMZ7_9VIRU|nr:helix-turn-helix domain-containing protein [Tetraselmis virus 1]AUF82263.1 helix-turn-helix domain-containing protein [Tetraselmis virus 1]
MHPYHHQDWNTVVLNKPKKNATAAPPALDGQQKKTIMLDKADGETFSHTKINSDTRKELVTLRTSKKLTQKELARRLNLQPKIIEEYENGKAIIDKQVLNKIFRFLKK